MFIVNIWPINWMRSTWHCDRPVGSLALNALNTPSETVSAVALNILLDGVGDDLYYCLA